MALEGKLSVHILTRQEGPLAARLTNTRGSEAVQHLVEVPKAAQWSWRGVGRLYLLVVRVVFLLMAR